TQQALVLAEQGVKVGARQRPYGDIVDGDGGGHVRRLGHERRFANDLALTDEVQHPLLTRPLADEDAHPTRLDHEQLVGRVADAKDRFSRADAAPTEALAQALAQ